MDKIKPRPEINSVESENVKYEPKLLPTKDGGEVFPYGDREFIPEQENVVEKFWSKGFDVNNDKYRLMLNISGLNYLFRLSGESGRNPFGLSFKTTEYEYAITNLDKDGESELFERLADFLETAYVNSRERIILIEISPADSSYSVEEIEDCVSKILGKTDKYSEEELRSNYKGFKIFDLYEDVFGVDYHDVHYNSISRASARSRYFKIKFKKYFKNWEVDDFYKDPVRFYLRRKSDKPSFSEE